MMKIGEIHISVSEVKAILDIMENNNINYAAINCVYDGIWHSLVVIEQPSGTTHVVPLQEEDI